MQATLNFVHVSTAYISQAGLVSKYCEKASVISSQLWMLEASKMSGEYACVDWNSSDTMFSPSKNQYAHTITTSPEW